ncbi:DUF11 domain-containing protein [Parerythrobacter jejuensis]|uniref:DUF11 domain-containing protein n=1 Tax=Parerythrobacter jejuensis TaxID=795812 RepID=A0A845APG0_9SPHN|nr:DUF11 domain-containing protein [Parerythrobacter jejuensis]MXP32180.1 DUF11 domain-containing protein [Parerythrobacter jejuensis]
MKRSKQLLGAVSSVALIAFSTSPALAAGTTAGDTITNTVTVDFEVGGVNQTDVTATDTFTVDRKVNVTVSEVGGATTNVSPGGIEQVTTFDVTNLSNDTIDLDLSVAQPASDDFDVTNVKFFIDDGDGVFDAGDTEVTFLDEVAEDETVRVFVVGDIPISQSTGDVAEVILTADSHAGGTASSLGAELTATAGANTAGVDTVLADGAGDTDAANDGAFSDTDSYTVQAAALTAAKSSVLISDPVNGTTNPKAIPGAVVEYCIAVSNGAGSATATGVTVSDVLPADVTYDAGFGIFVNGTFDGVAGTCNADGTAGGSFGSGTVSGSLSDIAAGVTRTLYFRATIN